MLRCPDWWEKGAGQEDETSLLMLGSAYMDGTCGFPQNTVCAKIYMQGAANLGDAKAIELLKVLRATGRVCRAAGGLTRVHHSLAASLEPLGICHSYRNHRKHPLSVSEVLIN